MNRKRKLDEELWEDSDEELSSDHVVERFLARHEHDDDHEPARRVRPGARVKRRPELPSDEEA
jgi:hypothetical protein